MKIVVHDELDQQAPRHLRGIDGGARGLWCIHVVAAVDVDAPDASFLAEFGDQPLLGVAATIRHDFASQLIRHFVEALRAGRCAAVRDWIIGDRGAPDLRGAVLVTDMVNTVLIAVVDVVAAERLADIEVAA